MFRRAAAAGLRLALIGGNPGTAEQARGAAGGCGWTPDAQPAAPHSASNAPEADGPAPPAVVRLAPHIVFVGLGSPKQEQLIRQLRSLQPQAWFLGVGISFSFAAGEVPRAPAVDAGRRARMGRTGWRRSRSGWARRYLSDGLPFASA
ncbi:MAG: WecB/TagA/CpsF family glycosyltransferase [Pseudorhodoferax sp.]